MAGGGAGDGALLSEGGGRAVVVSGSPRLVLVKGAGELGSGVAWRLHRAGFSVVMTDREQPLAVRRTVAFCEALALGEWTVEGVTARRAETTRQALEVVAAGDIPVLADPQAACRAALSPRAVVDAIMAKRNTGTAITDADVVVALGPGFEAGVDCHAVVETHRGHFLGRVYYSGRALPDTGVPAERGGHGESRVLRAPLAGVFQGLRQIGERVAPGEVVGRVHPGGPGAEAAAVTAAIGGVLRGLIRDGTPVRAGLKVGDVDPVAEPDWCFFISDKALAVAGGVLEALLALGARPAGEPGGCGRAGPSTPRFAATDTNRQVKPLGGRTFLFGPSRAAR